MGESRIKKNSLSKENIIKLIIQNGVILSRFKVRSLALFSSFARVGQKKKRNFDFIVKFYEYKFENYIGLLLAHEKLFGRKICLTCKDALKNHSKPHILKQVEWIKK